MTFIDAVKTGFTKYADFSGRASRPEFWWWLLFTLLATAACGILSDKLAAVFQLAVLLPTLAVSTRRLHDTNRSGWMQLIGLIPIVGWILVVVWLAQAGKPGEDGVPAAD